MWRGLILKGFYFFNVRVGFGFESEIEKVKVWPVPNKKKTNKLRAPFWISISVDVNQKTEQIFYRASILRKFSATKAVPRRAVDYWQGIDLRIFRAIYSGKPFEICRLSRKNHMDAIPAIVYTCAHRIYKCTLTHTHTIVYTFYLYICYFFSEPSS